MPSWNETLLELESAISDAAAVNPFDTLRRRYLKKLQQHVQRDVVLYASAWTHKDSTSPFVALNEEDMEAFMTTVGELEGDRLDLILHSPGGSGEVAEAIVHYLRSRYVHIRVVVPQLAMSAATMIACAADEIVMGQHSFLGPTDPQMMVATQGGLHMMPAQAILDQFDRAVQESQAGPGPAFVWLQFLSQLPHGLLIQCETELALSRELVQDWLHRYMFKNKPEDEGRHLAGNTAAWLADHQVFKSHNRHIARAELEQRQMNIVHLEDDNEFEDFTLTVFHATTLLFNRTRVVKVVENHRGTAFIKHDSTP